MKCRFVCRSVRVVLLGLTALCLSSDVLIAAAWDPAAPDYSGHKGKTFYVSKLGDSSDGSSWQKAFRTIQAALLAVPDDQGGHQIVVRPDTYVEANLDTDHKGAAGADNLLIGDSDGERGSGATGRVIIDSAQAYGLPPARAVSADDGRTWRLLPRETADRGTAASWQSPPLRLPNGDLVWAQQQRPLKATDLKLPEKPCGQFVSYGHTFDWYRVEDLPPECSDGWILCRLPAGAAQPRAEQAKVRLPGEMRHVTEGVLPRPWLQTMFLAPDGAIWAVQYDNRLVNGTLKKHWWPMILRSTHSGRTFDLWSEIPYAPDAAADPKAATRNGFTEPTVCFLPDGSLLCLMRTTDGSGPGPLYCARSTDNGKTWSQPAVFDDLGVWPQLLRLKNGVTLAVYGRPGLYVRATADPAGLRWAKRVTVVPPGAIGAETCSYAALLPLSDNHALLAYSDFNLRNAEGKRCKGIRVREVRARSPNAN